MLEVQKYLIQKSKELGNAKAAFDALNAEYAIEYSFHPTKPLVICNYSQIDSPKTPQVVRECRGLTLNSETFELVGKSFNRFFNLGEMLQEAHLFDFTNFIVDEKVDGSLVSILNYGDTIHTFTRGSFADQELEGSDKTWGECIVDALGDLSCRLIELHLLKNPKITLVCEFCSLWNKVVRVYNVPTVYLLSAFNGKEELHWDEVDQLAKNLCLQRPKRFKMTSIEEVEKFISDISETDKTFEGVVIRDKNNNRQKVKTLTYLALHRMSGNGNCFLVKNILPFVLSGESDELLTYFKEVESKYNEVKKVVDEAFETLKAVWEENKSIIDQKTFALAIKNRTPFTSILFTLKKTKGLEQTLNDLKDAWKQSGDSILKNLFKD